MQTRVQGRCWDSVSSMPQLQELLQDAGAAIAPWVPSAPPRAVLTPIGHKDGGVSTAQPSCSWPSGQAAAVQKTVLPPNGMALNKRRGSDATCWLAVPVCGQACADLDHGHIHCDPFLTTQGFTLQGKLTSEIHLQLIKPHGARARPLQEAPHLPPSELHSRGHWYNL